MSIVLQSFDKHINGGGGGGGGGGGAHENLSNTVSSESPFESTTLALASDASCLETIQMNRIGGKLPGSLWNEWSTT